MKKLFIINLLSFVLLIFKDNLYANNSAEKLIETLFKDNSEKPLNNKVKNQKMGKNKFQILYQLFLQVQLN